MPIASLPALAGPLRHGLASSLLLAASFTLPSSLATAQVAGPNVNMVSGTTWPDGDPFLQRQNEPSIAVSTRNPLHLLGGANDYRTVDLPGLPEGKETGDAWLGAFRSVDGGGSWKSTLVRGYPQDQTGASPLHGYEAAADPVVRAGTNGLFYYSGIVFDRSLLRSAAFMARFMDLNNETVEPVRYIDTKVVASFNAGEAFIDKPWLETDVPRAGAQTVTLLVPQGNGAVSQTVPCGNAYMAWAEITGQGPTLRTRIMFSRSTDCGGTWSTPQPISLAGTVGQGASIAVVPATGRIYVAWRQFHLATVDCVQQKGYWKNTPSAWPVVSLTVGGVSYTKSQALVILQKSYPPSDAPGSLAQQLIPAKLNVFAGAENDAIEPVIAAADAWLVKFPLGSKPSSADKQAGLALKDKLEAFNSGLGGTSVCTAAATSYPDAVMVVNSDNAGVSFSAPLQVATVSPFDQGTSEYSFRTNAYPTMAVDETGRAYLAWATRGLATSTGNPDPVAGDARIVVTTSTNGTTWTTPRVIDQPAKPGHQLFPSLTYNAGKLVLVYNDFRADASQVFERFVVDLLDATHPMRHTVDVRMATASPADVPVFTDYSILKPSAQVSRYPFIVTGTGASDAASLQLQYNPPNLPMFQLGHAPFFGDYLDVAGAPRFVPNGDGTWSYNTAFSAASVYHAVWTDNRDVVGPSDGDWTNYVPPGTGHTSLFDGSTPVPNCETTLGGADRTQMRNQNVYTSRLTTGLYVAAPSNARPLTTDFQRAFVIYVENATSSARAFQLEILNQPAGGSASFQQFSQASTQAVTIGAYSSISQTVFVRSSSPAASIDVRVTETGNCGTTCLQSTVRINPDATNPPPADAALQTGETYNPAVFNPAVYNPAVYNPAVLNPAVFNPAVFNLDPSNPAVLNFGVDNPAVFNPAVLNPAVFNPAVFNPAVFNLAVTSLAFLNPAVFNPAVLNPAVLNPAVFNPAVFNPAVLNPAVLNPAVFNPAVFNPAVLNPAVFNPAVFNPAVYNGSVSEASFEAMNTGNTTAAYSFNLNLANQQPALSYQLMIYRLYFVPAANGCALTEAAQQELLVNDLAPRLTASLYDPNGGDSFFLNPGERAIATLRVVPDQNVDPPGNSKTFNIRDLSVSVVSKGVDTVSAAAGSTQPAVAQLVAPNLPPLVITTTVLPGGFVGSAHSTTLAASGGTGSYSWSAFGALPPGITLSPAGVLSGMPTTVGNFTFTTRVIDGTQLAEKVLTLTVASLPPAVSIVIDTAPTNVTGGQPFTLQFRVEDGGGAPIPGATVTISLASKGCPAAVLSGSPMAISNANGLVQFPNLSIDRGGYGFTIQATSGTASATAGPINVEGFCDTGSLGTPRGELSAPLLPNAKVLYAGGTIAIATATATAELFDPSGSSGVGSFSPTGSMATARSRHQTTLLADGRVLVSGGSNPVALASAEIYDSASGTFSPTGSMSAARAIHRATRLNDGKVLVTGGNDLPTAELFDPAGNGGLGAFVPGGSMGTARTQHTATLLADGRVLVCGGIAPGPAPLASAGIYEPSTNSFSSTGAMSVPRYDHASTLLPDGRVLISGGRNAGGTLTTAELFDPVSGTFSATGALGVARSDHAATLLPDGSVLVSGGSNSGGFLASAEVFDPVAGVFRPSGNMSAGRRDHGATLLVDGRVLIGGGVDTAPLLLTAAELFYPTPPMVFLVANTADAGAGSLRQAILDANAHPGQDAIHFAISGSGVQTISPASALPVITDPVFLDATTQPGYAGTPLIRLDGAGLAGPVTGIPVTAHNSLVQGFMVTRFPGVGIELGSATGTRVAHNYVGCDGAAILGNIAGGIFVTGGSGNTVENNVVSGNNADGIVLRSGTNESVLRNNRVGTDATGTAALPNNGWGIRVYDSTTSRNAVRSNLASGNVHSGIYLHNGTHHNTVAGNLVGSNAQGTGGIHNEAGLMLTDGAHHNIIGGTSPADGNVILGNTNQGIFLTHIPTTGNVFLGNWIGTNPIMSSGLGNAFEGVLIQGASNNRIGGTAAGEANVIAFNQASGVSDLGVGNQALGNLISGNHGEGIRLDNGSSGARIASNKIGTDPTGSTALGNTSYGILITGTSSGNAIGGPGPADGNVVSGNGLAGLYVAALGHDNVVENNRIGTNAAGNLALPNSAGGIAIIGGVNNTLRSNVVLGNINFDGIDLGYGAAGNLVENNFIGVSASGNATLGNQNNGLWIYTSDSASNIVRNNVISGCANTGVSVTDGAHDNIVTANNIGTDAAGTTALGNGGDGILIGTAATANLIADNVLAANDGGILLSSVTQNTIRHNWVGTNAALASGLGNRTIGIRLYGSSNNLLGGGTAADGNVIAQNGGAGVLIDSGSGNAILSNSMFANTGLGIDLGGDGVTLNDVGDTDTGANDLINFPVLTSAVDDGSQTTVIGSVDVGIAGATLYIQFFSNDTCDPNGYGEGQTLVGTLSVVTAGDGTATFSTTLPTGLAGKVITATANTTLGAGGNTSEFSACVVTALITEFTLPTAGSLPFGIALGPDGNLWFTEYSTSANKIGRITTAGVLTEFPVPTALSEPTDIAAGPDGNLWFTETSANKIGRITTAGAIAEFSIPTSASWPGGIAAGPDGALWFTESVGNQIGRITTAGLITEFPVPTASSQLLDIAVGPDGALWFTERSGNKIGRITTAGVVTEFPVPTASSEPFGIAAGPDGALWFIEWAGNKIGRITTAGVVTEFPVPTAGSSPYFIAAGPDGALWFTEGSGNKIGRITTAGVVTEFPLPTAGSLPYGIVAGPDGALWFTEWDGNRIGRLK